MKKLKNLFFNDFNLILFQLSFIFSKTPNLAPFIVKSIILIAIHLQFLFDFVLFDSRIMYTHIQKKKTSKQQQCA
jgi:hypothetical protein